MAGRRSIGAALPRSGFIHAKNVRPRRCADCPQATRTATGRWRDGGNHSPGLKRKRRPGAAVSLSKLSEREPDSITPITAAVMLAPAIVAAVPITIAPAPIVVMDN